MDQLTPRQTKTLSGNRGEISRINLEAGNHVQGVPISALQPPSPSVSLVTYHNLVEDDRVACESWSRDSALLCSKTMELRSESRYFSG